MDAGRAELYAAGYDACSTPPRETAAPWLAAAADVLDRAAASGVTIIAGPGTHFASPPAARVARAPERLAGAAGRVAACRGAASGSLAPLYIRPPDALLKRQRS
jgi:sugar phosphate isomerase/epimerase